MASAFGAGAGADMLQQVLAQKFREAIAQQEMQQRAQAQQAELKHYGAIEEQARRQTDLQQQRFDLEKNPPPIPPKPPGVHVIGNHLVDDTGREVYTAPTENKPPIPIYQVGRGGQVKNLGEAPAGSHIVNEPAPQREAAPQLVMVDTVDTDGNPVKKIVPKTAGSEFVKPVGATVENRVASAKTVNDVGGQIISELSDPKLAAALGPALGRYNTIRDFIGNPPPEFSRLAGEIESYALANMGVHGMRSAQGAQQIVNLLDKKHTPQSLAATISGLNEFSSKFVTNTVRKPGGAGPTNQVGMIRARDQQGNIHEAPAGTALPQGWVQVK